MIFQCYTPASSIWVRRLPKRKRVSIQAQTPEAMFHIHNGWYRNLRFEPRYRCGECNISWFETPDCPRCDIPGTLLSERFI